LAGELAEAQKEYSEFAKVDPLYLEICGEVLPVVEKSPGIIQSDLYKRFPKFEKGQLSYALYFAAAHGKIVRIKKGRSYALSLSPSADQS